MTLQRAIRVAAWNLALLAGGAAALLACGEAWFRATQPFVKKEYREEWVPGVGIHLVPHSEVRWTNRLDFWVVSRANRFGFLDREPPSPARARASCHVAIVGDSFIDAREVSLSDKMHVRLEEMTARRLPAADVTTTSWGRGNSGQRRQLLFWDKWIHRYSPKLVVLVFVYNDIVDNSFRFPHSAERAPAGTLELELGLGLSTWNRVVQKVVYHVNMRTGVVLSVRPPPALPLPPNWPQFTAFALDQWLERTQRAGASLVILASHTMRTTRRTLHDGESQFDWLNAEAASRRIPVVDQSDYIARNGGRAGDAHWEHDGHWNPQGHQWAAEAMLEWLERNPQTCET